MSLRAALGALALGRLAPVAQAKGAPFALPERHIVVDLQKTAGPFDRFYDLSVGSDYPGTLLRDDSLGQLAVVVSELGFTPKAMATSGNSIFYWQGNTSHPDPKLWAPLVDTFVRHIEDRYGPAEVRTWFFKVWNEPNLSGFWEGADQKAYFDLYDLTARTLNGVDPELKVGGPSTAGAAWVPDFISRVRASGVPSSRAAEACCKA
jgi:xylan 1,4-beta-xylosidase